MIFPLPRLQESTGGACTCGTAWKERKTIQCIDLRDEGMIPLELRFLHDPDETQGYVGAALSTTVFRFYKSEVCDGEEFFCNYCTTMV